MSFPASPLLAPTLAAALVVAVLSGVRLVYALRAANRRAESIARALRVMTDKLDFQAHHDPLTGLSNGAHLEAMLETLLQTRGGQPPGAASAGALLYFDLDQFNAIIHVCGADARAELVKQVARRVRPLIRSGDTLARLDGDAFAALLPTCGAEDAQRRAAAIRKAIGGLRFHWGKRTFILGVSLGAVTLDEASGSAHAALLTAERACHQARHEARARAQPHDPDGHAPVTRPPAQGQAKTTIFA